MAVQIVANQITDLSIASGKLANGAVTPAKADLSTTWAFTAAPTFGSDPTADNQLVRKAYVDNLVQGLGWLESVRVKVDTNIDLTDPAAALDGVSLSNNDRVLLSNQTTGSEDGIYKFNGAGATMTRTADADAFAKLDHAAVFVQQGSSSDSGWVQSAALTGFSGQAWNQFTSTANARGAGNGLQLTGNNLDVQANGTTISVSASGVAVGTITDANITNGSISTGKLAATAITVSTGSGLSGGGSIALGGSATISAVNIADSNISASAAIADSKLATIATANKVSGSAVQLAANTAIEDSTGLRLKSGTAGTGLSLSTAQVLSVGGLTNSELSGTAGITDANLATIATANKVSGSAVQLAATSAIDNDSGLVLKSALAGTGLTMTGQVMNVGGLTNTQLSGTAGITDGNLATIATANKVSGTAVQLAATSAIQDSTGLRVNPSLAGTGLSMTNQVMTLTEDSLTVSAGTGLSGGGVVALGGSVTLNVASVGTGQIADDAVTSAKIGLTFAQKMVASHSSTTINLDAPINDAAQAKAVLCFRNGLAMENCTATSGTNDTVDKFAVTIADGGNSGNASIQIGATPSSDTFMVWYFS